MPAWSPAWTSWTSTSKPRRSAQRLYMRKSISAQSQDSVPPAPAWMERIALFASNWPVRKEAISSLSSSSPMADTFWSSSFSWDSLSAGGDASTSSAMTSVSSTFFWNAITGSTARLSTFSLAMCFWARSLLSQNPGEPIWASMASISLRFWSTSKKPPQVAGALLDAVDVAEGLGGDHGGGRIEPHSGPTASGQGTAPRNARAVSRRPSVPGFRRRAAQQGLLEVEELLEGPMDLVDDGAAAPEPVQRLALRPERGHPEPVPGDPAPAGAPAGLALRRQDREPLLVLRHDLPERG